MPIPKRTIDEWVTVLQISPNVRRIFCEGPTDVRLIASMEDALDCREFFSADDIEDENPEDSVYGGNRTRLKKLGELVVKENCENCRVLIDADFRVFRSEIDVAPSIFYSDFANLPVGAIDETVLANFFQRGFGKIFATKNWLDLCSDLTFVFCLRFFVEWVGLTHAEIDFFKHSKFVGGRYIVDRNSIVRAFLPNSGSGVFSEAVRAVDFYTTNLPNDARFTIRSHDLSNYLFGYLRRSAAIGGAFPRLSVNSVLYVSLPKNLLLQPTVDALMEWSRN